MCVCMCVCVSVSVCVCVYVYGMGVFVCKCIVVGCVAGKAIIFCCTYKVIPGLTCYAKTFNSIFTEA